MVIDTFPKNIDEDLTQISIEEKLDKLIPYLIISNLFVDQNRYIDPEAVIY
ncbi:hypothetical protein J4440_02860 [Candidatus Woesearchaeota archaeon]|nr:hypothetical protein [Candidatus Woesearchaeota archaeon]